MSDTSSTIRAAIDFVKKIEAIHQDPRYIAVWECAQIHRGPYAGPTCIEELATLKRELEWLMPEAFSAATGASVEAGGQRCPTYRLTNP